MNLGVISDIHGNYRNLADSVAKLCKQDCTIVCLGALVSEDSTDNDRCVQLIKDMKIQCVKGQHDDTCAKVGSPAVSPESRRLLASLPVMMKTDNVVCVHDNPLERARSGRGMWAAGSYIWSVEEADVVFEDFALFHAGIRYVLVGHTHIPKIFGRTKEVRFEYGKPVYLGAEEQYIINPGKIGGADRRSEPGVSCAVLNLDDNVITFAFKKWQT